MPLHSGTVNEFSVLKWVPMGYFKQEISSGVSLYYPYISPYAIISHTDIWTSHLAMLSATDKLLTELMRRGAYLYQLINFTVPWLSVYILSWLQLLSFLFLPLIVRAFCAYYTQRYPPPHPPPSCDILKWLPVLKIHEHDQLSVNGGSGSWLHSGTLELSHYLAVILQALEWDLVASKGLTSLCAKQLLSVCFRFSGHMSSV